MIIRSQDKTMIMNFNNASNVYKQGLEIWINTFHGVAKIAEYSTEEKAIKVLDMIQNKYFEHMTVENNGAIVDVLERPKVFQMPQDSEV